jgi:hypothetical protein
MRHGTVWSNKALRDAYPMDSRQATAALTGLVAAGLAEPVGEGSARAYHLARPEQPSMPAAEQQPPRPRAGSRREENAQRLLALLLQDGPATLTVLAARCELTGRQTQYALELLREQGRIELLGGRGTTSRYRVGPTA